MNLSNEMIDAEIERGKQNIISEGKDTVSGIGEAFGACYEQGFRDAFRFMVQISKKTDNGQ